MLPPKDTEKQDQIQMTQRVSQEVFKGLRRYKKDLGLSSEQDAVRILCATGLIREGYLERSSD